jgi:ribosomal-protein-serine acetyltransferase
VLICDALLDTRFPGPVALRRLTAGDAAAFSDHVAGDVDRLGEYLPWPARTATPLGAKAWLGRHERQETGRVLAAGAWNGSRLIGRAVLFSHDATQRNIEIGCWVVAAGEGRGVASAASRALLALARGDLQVERVEWRTASGNTRSRELARRLGFRHEGTLRSNYVLRGTRINTDVLSLIGSEIDQAATTGTS